MATAPQRVSVSGTPASRAEPREHEDAHGYGWVMFAGVMLVIAGTMNAIYGIAAIANSTFYLADTRFVIGDLNTWGWIVMLIGALQLGVGAGVWAKAQWARWTGVFIAALSGIAQLVFIPAYPWLALAVFAVNMFIIYGLIAYGGRTEAG